MVAVMVTIATAIVMSYIVSALPIESHCFLTSLSERVYDCPCLNMRKQLHRKSSLSGHSEQERQAENPRGLGPEPVFEHCFPFCCVQEWTEGAHQGRGHLKR